MDTDINPRTTAKKRDFQEGDKDMACLVEQLREKTDELLRLVQQTYARTGDLWNSGYTNRLFSRRYAAQA